MARKKIFGYVELQDGTVYEDYRVGLQTKLQSERTAKSRKWDTEADGNQLGAFMAWHAAKLAGHIDMKFDDFIATAVDAGIYQEGDDDDEAEAEFAEDPTRADQ